jgi:hypothetical protein
VKPIFATAGLLGGLVWMALAFFPPVGVRETRAYEVVFNRLWTPALLAMLLGFIGLYRVLRPSLARTGSIGFMVLLGGFALMVVGNLSEYWLLSDLPHQGPDGFSRSLAWMTFLFGTLLVLIASMVVGITGLHTGRIPRWLSWLFILSLPLTIAIGFVSMNWAGLPIGILSVAVGGFGLLPILNKSKA